MSQMQCNAKATCNYEYLGMSRILDGAQNGSFHFGFSQPQTKIYAKGARCAKPKYLPTSVQASHSAHPRLPEHVFHTLLRSFESESRDDFYLAEAGSKLFKDGNNPFSACLSTLAVVQGLRQERHCRHFATSPFHPALTVKIKSRTPWQNSKLQSHAEENAKRQG